MPGIDAATCRTGLTSPGANPATTSPAPDSTSSPSPQADRRTAGHAGQVLMAPIAVSSPATTNVAFITLCQGEHTSAW
jgi:hypothetical protein